jgi:hypothetical protein
MGLSWHNLFYGAIDPSGQVACEPVRRCVKANGVNVSRAVRPGHGRILYRLPA